MDLNPKLPLRYILTVTELTQEIKNLLEERFSEVWVEGEISNLRIPPSGHLYFTLKDDFSQIRAVLFRMQARSLRFLPEDGLQVLCRGRVSLYEKRGDYQLILESMEPKGIGALQLAFLQLKEKLEKEGLFALDHKKTIPMVPQRIGIITSPTGAVIRDMLHILQRRFENVQILLYPVRVQGEGAWQEIAQGIEYFNGERNVDVLIIGRGGGSLEDLWPFNEEGLARVIYRSKIPIISAVGHETDYTVSDFVADLRAPTPSAAAELVVKDKREVKNTLSQLRYRLESQMTQTLQEFRTHLKHLRKILGSPRKAVDNYFLRVDELSSRLQRMVSWILQRYRERSLHLDRGLCLRSPEQKILHHRFLVLESQKRLEQFLRHSMEIQRERVKGILGKLDSLGPLSILQRGYSITRKIPALEILRDATQVCQGDEVEVRLHRGALLCEVKKIGDQG
ncbi:MAG: exodeoxyribonuclease VII large subunit [Deltaproteobacteria bacterium RBG_16_48_10]|nr:MAG: exodeoxyribonuclease VII large subunit [Deltaproteobacteria bacterium RBG_16_48_10]